MTKLPLETYKMIEIPLKSNKWSKYPLKPLFARPKWQIFYYIITLLASPPSLKVLVELINFLVIKLLYTYWNLKNDKLYKKIYLVHTHTHTHTCIYACVWEVVLTNIFSS